MIGSATSPLRPSSSQRIEHENFQVIAQTRLERFESTGHGPWDTDQVISNRKTCAQCVAHARTSMGSETTGPNILSAW